MVEVIAEKMRRDALRAEGKPLSGEPEFKVVRDTDTTPQPTIATPKRPRMNKTETRYAERLAAQKAAGELDRADFEAVTLKLGDDVRYTPDFMVTRVYRHIEATAIEFHEVKGAFIRDDARVKLRVAATLFPMFRFFLSQYVKGQWTITPIEPR